MSPSARKMIAIIGSLMLSALLFWSGAKVNAAGDDLETSFTQGIGANDTVNTIALQSDGKIIIGGMFTTYNGASRNGIARLNADGSLDTTFNPSAGGADEPVNTIVVQANGKIIISGHFTTYNGTARNRIVRLNTDGSLDTTFNPGVGANGNLWTTVVQLDGKIIIGGPFTTYNGIARSRVARLNADGSLDTTFNPGRGAYGLVQTTDVSIVQTAAVQADGKIIIGGHFTTYNVTARSNIARLNANGSLDTIFNVGTGADDEVSNIALQSDGKIIISGGFTTYNGVARNRIARLNTDSSLDTTFNPSTGTDGALVNTIVVQANGKIIIGGMFTTNNNGAARSYLMRLNADGSLDTTFNVGGRPRLQ
jgi:uncharacterized delta-60 repeat protein